MSKETNNTDLNEHSEPVAGNAQGVVTWFIVALLGCFGFYRVDELKANFSARVHAPYGSIAEVDSLSPSEEELAFSKGKVLYGNCIGCHQPNGDGLKKVFPPLAGSEWVTGNPERAVAIIVNGLGGPINVAGEDFNSQMAAVGAALTDDEVASVLTYIRQAWGNGGSPVKPEEVKTMRDKINEKGQADPWTVESLIKAFPEK
ncbi:MAG: hypothetical protein CMJ62_21530 [Planctomycetaceae bacterium]|jgi:mono/diheme cytochrome c family protein|nr:hypothetical protein [Planctomycetaceae bacterium]|tara:strand:+ start:1612 stop:2217 length:606 start_codon:yes stop_codon:yes gene_type:complete